MSKFAWTNWTCNLSAKVAFEAELLLCISTRGCCQTRGRRWQPPEGGHGGGGRDNAAGQECHRHVHFNEGCLCRGFASLRICSERENTNAGTNLFVEECYSVRKRICEKTTFNKCTFFCGTKSDADIRMRSEQVFHWRTDQKARVLVTCSALSINHAEPDAVEPACKGRM